MSGLWLYSSRRGSDVEHAIRESGACPRRTVGGFLRYDIVSIPTALFPGLCMQPIIVMS